MPNTKCDYPDGENISAQKRYKMWAIYNDEKNPLFSLGAIWNYYRI